MKAISKFLVWVALAVFFTNSHAIAQTTATATAVLFNGFVVGVNVTGGGSGYSFAPSVAFTGGGGSGAGAYSTVSNGVVVSITVTNAGGGYTNAPQVIIAAPSTTPFASSLVLDLPIDGTVADVGPYQFTVYTNNGGIFTTNRSGQANSAFMLNGANQNISVPYDARLFPVEMTLSLWINFQNVNNTVLRSGNSNADGWRGFAITFSSGNLLYLDFTGSGYNANIAVPASSLVAGNWYQFVVTRSSNACSFFINGAKVATQTNLTPYVAASSTPLSVGSENGCCGDFWNFCQAAFDSVHIYNRALADSEVTSLYTNEAPKYIPVLGIGVSAVRVYMHVQTGSIYQLQTSSNLVSWASYGNPFTATNTTAYEDVNIIDTLAQYFRLQVVQQ